MATWRKGTGTVTSNGVPVANVTVYVYEKGTTTPATIYSDEGITPIDQATDPILSDAAGRYAFYLDVETYPQFRIFLDPSSAAEGYNFDLVNADLDGISLPAVGATGSIGPRGLFGGDSFGYVFSTETGEADPGSGKLRYNHAVPGDATEIYIDDEDEEATDIQAWLRTLDDSTSTIKGRLKVFKESDASKFATYNITAITEEAGYFKLSVTAVASASTFSDADEIVVSFAFTGDKGDTGGKGDKGDQGDQGLFGGDSFEYVFDTTTAEADPGSGKLRYDDADPALVAEIYIDDEDANAVDIQAWLRTLDDSTSTNKGHLRIFKKDDSLKFATYSLTAISEEAGYFKLTVTPIASNSTFSDADEIVVTFGATGNAGTMTGPGVSTDHALVRFDGVGGGTVQDGKVIEDDDGNLSVVHSVAFDQETELTIAEGVITATQALHRVDTQEDDPSDDLVTINGGVAGLFVRLRAENAARTVVLKDGTGNLELGGADITLDDTDQYVELQYDATLAKWVVIGGVGGVGDVTAAANIGDHKIVRGDGGAKGIQESVPSIDDTGNLDMGDGPYVKTDKVRAYDGAGLLLEDDGGNGIEVVDGGIVNTAKQSGVQVLMYNGGASQVLKTGVFAKVLLDTEIAGSDKQNEMDVTTKSGAADQTEANKLHDADGGFEEADVGAAIWNTTDNTHALVTAFVDSGELTLDTDIMADTENYKLYRARFTVTVAGNYFILVQVDIDGLGADKKVNALIKINGAGAGGPDVYNWSAGELEILTTTVTTVTLAALDYIEFFVRHNHGSNRNLLSAAGLGRNYIVIQKVT